jgi:hypothetical protein
MPRILIILAIVFSTVAFSTQANADCHTHKCLQRVRIKSVEKKIRQITPYRCPTMTGIFRSARPCWIIEQESAMVRVGPWNALNTWTRGVACLRRACGPYQFLGWNVPWPVMVKDKYERLKRKLAHHRMALRIPLSSW